MLLFLVGFNVALILVVLQVPLSTAQGIMCHTCHWRIRSDLRTEESREGYEDYHISKCLDSTGNGIPTISCPAGRCYTFRASYTTNDGRKFTGVARNCGKDTYPTSGCQDKSPGDLLYLDGPNGDRPTDVATVQSLKVCYCNTNNCNDYVPGGSVNAGTKVEPLPLVFLTVATAVSTSYADIRSLNSF